MASNLKLVLAIGLLVIIALALPARSELQDHGDDEDLLRSGSRFLASAKPKKVKCNKNPLICLDKNSGAAGPYCCKKKCVDILTDYNNCGRCNNKCTYRSGCCNGRCSNLAYDTRNCGKCGNKCKQGSRCVYGMCSYA